MTVIRLFLFLTCVWVGASATAGELSGVLENNRGVRKFNEKKPVEAFSQFSNALGELPYSGDVHYNLATAFFANQEYAKAITEYAEAIRNAQSASNTDRATRFRSYFNMAQAYTAQKQIDEALATYQLALNEDPESIETKTNIELLTAMNQGGGKGDKDQQDPNQKDPNQKNGDQKDKKDQKDGKDPQKDQKDPKDGKDQKDQKDQDKNQKPKPKPTPRPFDSQQISPKEVGTILDELKRQEEQIRARMQNDKVKDVPVGKDW